MGAVLLNAGRGPHVPAEAGTPILPGRRFVPRGEERQALSDKCRNSRHEWRFRRNGTNGPNLRYRGVPEASIGDTRVCRAEGRMQHSRGDGARGAGDGTRSGMRLGKEPSPARDDAGCVVPGGTPRYGSRQPGVAAAWAASTPGCAGGAGTTPVARRRAGS